MRAVLSDLGIIDSRNDMLTISMIRGTNSALHSFRSQVGKGSSSHDLTGDSLIIFHIFSSVASIKVFSITPEKQFVCVSVNPSSLLMFNILLVKGAEIVWQFSFTSMNWEDLVFTIPHHISVITNTSSLINFGYSKQLFILMPVKYDVSNIPPFYQSLMNT